MFRRLKNTVHPALANLSPEERRRLFWGIYPLLMIGVLTPGLRMVGMPFWFTFSVQVVALIGMIWLFVRALRKAKKAE
jgi:hypothetical protein